MKNLDELAIEKFASDLSTFADLGAGAPRSEFYGANASIFITRNGEPTELRLSLSDGRIQEIRGEDTTLHASFKALLASDRYGALRTWAARQKLFFAQHAEVGTTLDVGGSLNGSNGKCDIPAIEVHLASVRPANSTRILLIDGPAGIGKTQFITSLAQRRAEAYGATQAPLILHIQSRGRTLSYLSDLMAFSLQRLRLEVTFDQVPTLVKYGLVTVAVDGFDELADPEGYGMAWSQVNELVGAVRGEGTLILAGRETFVGRSRLLRDLKSLRPEIDDLSVLTLSPPTKADALRFFEAEGWTEEQRSAIESFLEPSSLALRPFFLRSLSDSEVASQLIGASSTSILAILVEAMVERELLKFGEEVERELGPANIRRYVYSLMSEVARDLADNSNIAISDGTLSFLVEASLPIEVSDRVLRILKTRVGSIAFLTNDDRPGYKGFQHEKFYEYFLSKVIIDSVSAEQSIKPIARNLLASSFLDTFGTIVSAGISESEGKKFLDGALKMASSYAGIDRTRRNIGALLIASLSISDLVERFTLDSIETDEVRFAGTASPAKLRKVVISQFDCRGADLSEVVFEDCVVVSLIGDEATMLPASFPIPSRIQDVARSADIVAPSEVKSWVNEHLRYPTSIDKKLLPDELKSHSLIRLLHKACRLKQYWIRRGENIYSVRILDDPYWPILENILARNDLLRVETRQASGTDARFIHIKKSYEILSENENNENVVALYKDLTEAAA